MPNSIPISWLWILTVCIRVSIDFSFLANGLMSSMYITWFIFTCDLVSLYPDVHFLGMGLSGIIAIINSNGDSASPWNIPLWIFALAKLFLLQSISLSRFPGFFDQVYDFIWYFVPFWDSLLSSFVRPYHMTSFSQSRL